MLTNEILDKPTIEKLLPKSMFYIHELLSEALRDNGVLQA
jgi:hypothetical protein